MSHTVQKADLLQRAARIIDTGQVLPDQPINPLTNELFEIGEDLAYITSFARVVAIRTTQGIVLVDTSTGVATDEVLRQLRQWCDERIHTVIYTHGHMDHVTGSAAIVTHAQERGEERPRFVGHANIARRLARYERSNDFNLAINTRQNDHRVNPNFTIGPSAQAQREGFTDFVPAGTVRPDVSYEDYLNLTVGQTEFELHHVRAETDDHTWIHLPQHDVVIGGDLISWNFPNAGNPQKVTRFPTEWAGALRSIVAVEPQLYVPMHGIPIPGTQRIERVLGDTATALEMLIDQVLAGMNAGEDLDSIVAAIRMPTDLLARPYLQARYDDPEFVVRAIWREYGGWWDGDPAHLKPAREAELAQTLGDALGGAEKLAVLARNAQSEGKHAVSAQLAAWALHCTPQHSPLRESVAELYREVYRSRAEAEPSAMCRGVFLDAAARAE